MGTQAILVPTDILHTIFNSTVLPIINYSSTVWGNCGDNKLKKLQKYQNRTARIITNNFDWYGYSKKSQMENIE